MTYVVAKHIFLSADFDGVSNKAKYGTDPEKHGETPEEVLAELDPFRRHFWWRQGVRAVTLKNRLGLGCC